jgi:DNA-binding NarL/FixJ family response regulator
MRTTHTSPARSDAPCILIIDSKKLHQAGIIRLLETWTEAVGLKMTALAPDTPFENCRIYSNCEMVLLSVGSGSVEDPQQLACMKSLRTLVPNAPLVVLSDREEPKEVCAAFEAGATGFMPSSIEPSMALQALSFIKSGGSFFPPSALSRDTTPAITFIEKPAATIQSGQTVGPHQLMDRAGSLTSKQEEVFNLLRQGQTNKLIARKLGMSEATVKVHVRRIIRRFGVTNRTQAVISAMNESTLSRCAANGNGTRET